MKSYPFFSVISLCALMMTLSSCVSLSGFQDGRSIGKDNADLSFSLNVTQSPDFDADDDLDEVIHALAFTNVEIGGRFGVTETTDVSMRMNSSLAWSIGTKVQVGGDQNSKQAFSLGVEAGAFGFGFGDIILWNLQIPFYFSLHPTERMTWYLNPRVIYQFVGFEGGLGYAGGNTGLMFGSRHKFGLDIGYYSASDFGSSGSIGLFQIGIGARFKLGND